MIHTHSQHADLTDPVQFGRVYDEHANSVLRTALSVVRDPSDAQDVTQDVFLRLWRRPDSFDPSRGDLGAYLRMVARSRALDLLRRRRTGSDAQARLEQVAETFTEQGPADVVARASATQTVRDALARLPLAQREALVLNHLAGLTAEQIADQRKIPLGTVKSRMRLGLARLRSDLELQQA